MSEMVREMALPGVSRARLLLILGGVCALGPFAIDMYLPSFPALGDDLGAADSGVQLTITTFLVGLAAGQLFGGPLSDRFGRRAPLLAGLACFVSASIACAAAPSVPAFVALRLVQGFAGGTGIVVARAVVRDVYSDVTAARFYSALMLVFGLGPVLAPLFGGLVLLLGSWREILLALAALGGGMLGGVAAGLPETLPPWRRREAGLGRGAAAMLGLLRDRVLLGLAVPSALAHASMMSYIAGATFVLQDAHGFSPQLFSAVFAINALGLIAASQVSARVVERTGSRALVHSGLLACQAAGMLMLASVLSGVLELPAILIGCFTIVTSIGLINPNSLALGVERHRDEAGGAAAVFGTSQYAFGAAAAPLVGVAGADALPMTLTIAVLVNAAALIWWLSPTAP